MSESATDVIPENHADWATWKAWAEANGWERYHVKFCSSDGGWRKKGYRVAEDPCRWVAPNGDYDNNLPGLKEAFTAAEIRMNGSLALANLVAVE